ncbi:glutathione S-transferase family protein [Cognatiyoonia sp. IB215182]|uniref:glutathione S-transferase family protein n=1 Tax=Cognatiyoonia sp. IB215182 TaxID=3097353 RepID=UPI002A165F65|nr:glutathione S-transferase family protein [Cognatiyoonia sp. IB215182]MDX8355638.1 glutathione S-transferase family protein [Cognatiyoonia sp. IB215182]
MILVGQFDSPFVRRVAIALHHYGHPFERRVLSVFKDFDEMLAINPMGKVPSLILDDGETLFDSRAIIEYLDETAPAERRLAPYQQPERRRVLQIEVVGVTLAEKIYERGIEHNRRAPGTSDPIWRRRLEQQIGSTCEWLEDRLSGDWFFEEGFSRADLAVAVAMQYLERVLPMLESTVRYPRLHAHRLCCESREAFAAVRDARDEALGSGWTPET